LHKMPVHFQIIFNDPWPGLGGPFGHVKLIPT